jgi:predicted exporter
MARDEVEELRGEIVALETALAAAFGEIAVLRATVEGGGAEAALSAMEAMAAQLEGSVLRGVVGAEEQGRAAAAAGFERRMEQIAHALRNAIAFRAR